MRRSIRWEWRTDNEPRRVEEALLPGRAALAPPLQGVLGLRTELQVGTTELGCADRHLMLRLSISLRCIKVKFPRNLMYLL